MRSWIRWLGIAALPPVIFTGLIAVALANPEPFFAYHTTRGRLALYSDRPFDATKAQAILAKVEARLKTSPLDAGARHAIFVANSDWRQLLFMNVDYGAGGVNLGKPVADRLKRLWRQRGDVEFNYVWSGYVGMTPDNLLHPEVPGFPRIHRLGPNGFAWIGCNGRAVALSISLGRELARATQGTAVDTLGLPLSEPKPQPFQAIVRRIAPFALPLYRRLDAREI